MNAELRSQIRSNFNLKDTEELLEIWKTNDHVEWSDLAFEVLEEVLKEQVDVLPEQGEPILAHNEEPEDDLEDWEARILDSEEQPELYDTLEVIDTIDNLNKVAKAVIVVYALVNLFSSYAFGALFRGEVSLSGVDELLPVLWNLFTTIITTAARIAVIYFSLKALSHILRILMEIEFNSRKK